MILNIGDRVKIHSLEWFEKNFLREGSNFISTSDRDRILNRNMQLFCGKYVTIKHVVNIDSLSEIVFYRIYEDGCLSLWEGEYFEDYDENENYKSCIVKFCNDFCIHRDARSRCLECPLNNYKCSKLFKEEFILNKGDIVKVKFLGWWYNLKKADNSSNNGRDVFSPEMQKFCGKYVTISEVFAYETGIYYKIDSLPDSMWSTEYFEYTSILYSVVRSIFRYCDNLCILGNGGSCNNPECPFYDIRMLFRFAINDRHEV